MVPLLGAGQWAVGHVREDRMKTEIVIWEIDRASRAGTKLDLAKRVETEEMLEAVLVANPNILMRGLTLVGRQVPVETGYVDLLGVDEDGRLVVFELKREKLTRDVVAQILDYCSYLEALSDSELATLIAEHSGKGGINAIADFEEWYGSRGGRFHLARQDGTGRPRDRYERAQNGGLSGGPGHRHQALDVQWLRPQRWLALGPPGTDCGRSPHAAHATRPRLASEGKRARSRGGMAGCERVVGLQHPNVLYEIRHYLPAADDHPARRRACPRVAFRYN